MKIKSNTLKSTYRKLKNALKTVSILRTHQIIIKEVKSFSWLVIFSSAFLLLGAFFEGSTVGSLAALLQGLTNPDEISFQTGFHYFDDFILGINAPQMERVVRLSILLLSLTWLRAICGYLSSLFAQIVIFKVIERLRQRAFILLQSVTLGYFHSIRSSDLTSILFDELNQLKIILNSCFGIINQSLTIFAYLMSMLFISWQLTFTTLALFALLAVGLSSLRMRIREASFALPLQKKELFSVFISFINGIKSVHASSSFEYELQKFKDATKNFLTAQLKVTRSNLIVQPLVQALGSTLLVFILLYSYIFLIDQGLLQATSLLAFLFALVRVIPLLSGISNATSQVNSNYGSLISIQNLIRSDDKPIFPDGTIKFLELKEIKFKSVNFGYSPQEKVLFNINLEIPHGKITAFVGESGAGKTTLIDLIPRFYDPTQGSIQVNGIDLRQYEIKTLRDQMAIVSQDTYIFHASARDNISYGLENISNAQIIYAAEKANILDFINSLPDGFETILGDRGIKLSGGQRQRIAIARALLRESQILILDEATSALDSVTERKIQDALESLSSGKTVIVIAHRLSTIRKADKIVVLEKGKIIEEGNYNALINKKGALWKYHEAQFKN